MNIQEIDKTYILNLEKEVERRKSALAECDKVGIPSPKLWHGKEASFYNVPKSVFEQELCLNQRFNENAYACKANFIKLLKDARKHQYKYILFLEDDVFFDQQQWLNFSQCLSQLPSDFDIFNLGAYHFETPISYSDNLVQVQGAWLFHAAVISLKGIEKILTLFEQHVYRSADLTLGMVRFLQNGLQYYAPKITIAYQKDFHSKIAGQIDPKLLPQHAFDCEPYLLPEIKASFDNHHLPLTTKNMILYYSKLHVLKGWEHVPIKQSEAEFLFQFLNEKQSFIKKTIETGFAFGFSTVHIMNALPKARHIAIDPYQHSPLYLGTGFKNVKEFVVEPSRLTVMQELSHLALPKLIREWEECKESFQFAFIDGDHKFDYALLDFFYLDQLLAQKGFLFIHDTWMESIQKLCAFIATNKLEYKKMDIEGGEGFAIYCKIGQDTRNWDHYVNF